MGVWIENLTQAYEQKDMEKIGQLIEQMKQQGQGFEGRMRGGGPQGMRGPGGFGPRGPQASSRFGPELTTEGQSFFDSPPSGKTAGEKKILAVLDDMGTNQRRGMMNVSVEDGRLLRLLTETIGARHVVEIGASNGYSGVWFCLGLQKTGGKLTTHEIDAGRASLARENFKRADVDKLVTLVEGDAHETVTKIKEPIDVLFLDADKEGYLDYFNKLLPLVRPGGLIVAHNMNPGQADPAYVKTITTNPDIETLLLLREGAGVSVTLKKR
jgi:predicted O-methyltransferase YrrM